MSTRIGEAFSRAAREGRAAFIPYITAGYPSPKTCLDLIRVLEENGADLIELGLPFSAPLADGPVVRRSFQAALAAGLTPFKVLELAAQAREAVKAPLLMMTYWGPVREIGPARFAAQAREAGISGVIVPDLPSEEEAPWLAILVHLGLSHIFLLARSTPPDRRRLVFHKARGFLYYAALDGPTGGKIKVTASLLEDLVAVRAEAGLPVAVGFGVRSPTQAGKLARAADGVVVGSAVLREIMKHGEPGEQVAAAARFTVAMTRALRKDGAKNHDPTHR
ncbi:MAG: tryptophan synthase subunit alpha [Thermodesulfobacteriota bacterium]